jgi:hypothetical protein
MKLVSMKRSKKDRKEMMKPTKLGGDDYSYGLRIRLEKDDLDKLGMKPGDFTVGDYFDVSADCCVTSVSQSASSDHNSHNVELQIERLGMKADEENDSLGDAVDRGIKDAD